MSSQIDFGKCHIEGFSHQGSYCNASSSITDNVTRSRFPSIYIGEHLKYDIIIRRNSNVDPQQWKNVMSKVSSQAVFSVPSATFTKQIIFDASPTRKHHNMLGLSGIDESSATSLDASTNVFGKSGASGTGGFGNDIVHKLELMSTYSGSGITKAGIDVSWKLIVTTNDKSNMYVDIIYSDRP